MVDIFALALSHGLLALAAIRLLSRPELDREGEAAKQGGRFGARRAMKLHADDGADDEGAASDA